MFRKGSCADPCKLCYAVRFPVIYKYIGQLCFISSILSLFPLICSLILQEYHLSIRYSFVILFFLLIGLSSLKIKPPSMLQHNESLSIISFAFLFNSLVMSFPIMGNGLDWIDAWFEAVSGITTTGLSVADAHFGMKTFLLTRAFLQWYGGLGIVVFSLGLAMQPSIVTKSLGKELIGQEDLVSSVRIFARHMVLIYLILTASCFCLLFMFSPSFFDAFVHALTAVSTGGFSSKQESLANFSIPFQSIVSIFTFLGAVSMPFLWLNKTKKFRNFFANLQLLGLIIVMLLCFAFVFGISDLGIKDALFTAIAAQSTSGFSTVPIDELPAAVKLILSASMAIGGSVQSTAGGFKILRLLILLKGVQLIFLRTSLSKHAVMFPHILGYKLSEEEKNTCFSIILLFLFTTFASWFVFVLYGYDPLNSLFEVFSATGTVGLSTGITHSGLPSILKLILCIDMFLGRLEFITFVVLFLPKTLIGRRRSI